MAYRFGNYHWVRCGFVYNPVPGITRGIIELACLGPVALALEGNMQGELEGKILSFENPEYDPDYVFDHGSGIHSTARKYLEGFSRIQEGEAGDIRLDPYFYLEWYSMANARCVVELDRENCRILGPDDPMPVLPGPRRPPW